MTENLMRDAANGLKPGDLETVAKAVLEARESARGQIEPRTMTAIADALEVLLRHLANEATTR